MRLAIHGRRLMLGALISLAAATSSHADTTTPFPGGRWSPPAATYGAVLQTGVNITMSDGVVLKADISYPTDLATGQRAAGTFPVLLTQTPYIFQDSKAGDYFVQRGYIYVTAKIRGTTTSGGEFGFFSDRDAKDGAELVKWVANMLPGSNGVVGLHGNSYMGLTQFWTVAALGSGSPVKAMQPSCMGSEFYRETYFVGGIPTQTINFQAVAGQFMNSPSAAAAGAAIYADVLAGGEKAYDREFWKSHTVGNLVEKVADTNIPILLWSSDKDIYAQSSLELYAYLQNAHANRYIYGPMDRDKKPTGRYQILISQGGHCAGQDVNIQLEWFDTWLKGVHTKMEKTHTPIHVHELGTNQWINTSHYPVVPKYTTYYLNSAGALSEKAPKGNGQQALTWAQPGPGSTVQFETPVFENGARLAGPISARIFASSTTNNLELIATLQTVAPNGTATVLTAGTVLGSMAENDRRRSWFDDEDVPVRPYGKYDRDRYVPAGTVKQYDFAISPRFVRLEPGSKLRVVFTTQQPSGQPCTPVLGTDPCFPTTTQVATLTGSTVNLFHGPKTRSSIHLPLVKANCWRPTEFPNVPFWEGDQGHHGRDWDWRHDRRNHHDHDDGPCQR